MNISHIVHSQISGLGKPIILKNVLCIPIINKHLLSAYKLAYDKNVFIEFHTNAFFIKDKLTKKSLLVGKSKAGLYPVPFKKSSTPHRASSSVRVSSSQWHRHLGYPSSAVVKSILRSNNLGCSFDSNFSVCDACQKGKSHQLPYNNSICVTYFPLELVHTNVWGPAQVSSGGFKYYVSFVDDYSRYTWIYLIKRKSDVEQIFYNFQNHVERILNAKIHAI